MWTHQNRNNLNTQGVHVVKTIRPDAQGMLASPSAFTAGVLEACASDADVLLNVR